MEQKPISVSFPTGKDLLNAYWGMLANGGLIIRESPETLREGDSVALAVTIESSNKQYMLSGHVVSRPHDASRKERTVIAFDPGEPQDMLLSAAWSDSDNTPVRRHRRFRLDRDVDYRLASGRPERARLVDLSIGGCCLNLPHAAHSQAPVGETLVLLRESLAMPGVVRWVHSTCRGIEFESSDRSSVEQFVRHFL